VHRKGDQRGPQLTSATIEIFFKSALRLIDGQMSQMIYICYGITKSANTFLYQLTEEVFRAAGRKPARLGPPLRPRMSVENYFGSIDPTLLQDISVQAAGRDIVLKTHALPHPGVGRLITAGSVLASFRSREIALSILDHGRRSRRRGYVHFSNFHNLADTLAALDDQIATFHAWSSLGRVNIFRSTRFVSTALPLWRELARRSESRSTRPTC
jgi:hypothetical protein